MDVHVDANWAGCPATRQSTTGFVIYILGTPVSFGSRTQATIALSSAESELYAICTGTIDGLHLKMFLQESGLASKVNIRIQTLEQAKALLPDRVHQRKQSTSTYDSSTHSNLPKMASLASTNQHYTQHCRHPNKIQFS